MTGREELLDHLGVPVHAARLVERPFVVLRPSQCMPSRMTCDGFVGGALAVGVLDAQDEHAAVPARVQPGEQRRAHAADVQQAGGTGCETRYEQSWGRE